MHPRPRKKSINLNPFSHVIGPKYAPHSPTLSSTFKQKFSLSYAVIVDIFNLIFAAPVKTLDLISWAANKGLLLIDNAPVLIDLILFIAVGIPLYVLKGAVWLAKLAILVTAALTIDILSFTLAVAVSPITLIVHGIASLVYNSIFGTAKQLAGTKTMLNTASKDEVTTLGAVEKDLWNVQIEPVQDKSTSYKITADLRNNSGLDAEFKSSEFDLSEPSNPTNAATNAAVRSLLSLNFRGLATRLEEQENGYGNGFSF